MGSEREFTKHFNITKSALTVCLEIPFNKITVISENTFPFSINNFASFHSDLKNNVIKIIKHGLIGNEKPYYPLWLHQMGS